MYYPLFSILIANYNNGQYLQEAIDSVLAQTYKNWELVIVDDKSSDDSIKIYTKYKGDKRFNIVYNSVNKGCGYTKRRCAELAKGELCGFLDPDDKLALNAVEVMVEEHGKQSDCSLIYSKPFIWDGISAPTTTLDVVSEMSDGEDFLISSSTIISHFATFKAHYYKKTKGIDSKLKSAVDFDLYAKLEEVGRILFYDAPLYYYRITNPNSISIGNDSQKNEAYKNRIKSSLNAFCRRIRSNNRLFIANRARYLHVMRWEMDYFYKNINRSVLLILSYFFWYWKGCGFSCQSINHLRKILNKWKN